MQFYNTMSRKKETFTPVRKGLVGVYACGITAYALSHIGHARSAGGVRHPGAPAPL